MTAQWMADVGAVVLIFTVIVGALTAHAGMLTARTAPESVVGRTPQPKINNL
jgi:hypothetical protein